MKRQSHRVRIELSELGKGFYAAVLERGRGWYIVRPLNSRLALLLKDMLQKRRTLRARVGGKFAGFLLYKNGNFVLSAYLERRGAGSERITVYLKGQPVLTTDASVRVLTDAFGRRYVVYESPLLEKLPDGVYTLQDGRKGKKSGATFACRPPA
ncbi:MAG: hypothetical protein GXN93_04880 [Candidatus Diapherotrites archaeon]|nr:hypothetical protein [Candidatus Diapherotrites archaeon]